jgi:hypothetical protein
MAVIYTVYVGVCLERPPWPPDQYRRYRIEADDYEEAMLIATQMAACTSEMPVCCWPSGYIGDGRDRELLHRL